jgi:hypothetical protein
MLIKQRRVRNLLTREMKAMMNQVRKINHIKKAVKANQNLREVIRKIRNMMMSHMIRIQKMSVLKKIKILIMNVINHNVNVNNLKIIKRMSRIAINIKFQFPNPIHLP